MNSRRSSKQIEQETKSRHQLAERLIDVGWHSIAPAPDLGEDFIVDIYHEGKNTGINFYVQEKSVTNLLSRKIKNGYLVYPLKVKDLKHWESFSLPVILVIWDVILREGRWCLVKDLISYLDQNNSSWRKNKKDVQVYIPWKNNTTDEGLKQLKADVGKQVYPLISYGKALSINMKLAFPNTPEGIELRKAFDLHIKEGEPVTLKGGVIQELKFSDWWETWFGKEFDSKKAEIHIGEISNDRREPVSLRIIPVNGKTAILSNLEFKLIRIGTELIKFSNEHTTCPFLLTISMRKDNDGSQGSLNCVFRDVGGEPHEILNYLDFAKAMRLGGKLRVDFIGIGQSTSADFPVANQEIIDSVFYDLVQKLCVVQDKVGNFFRIPDEGILRKDAQSIEELFEVTNSGVVNYTNGTMSLELKGKGLQMLLDLHKEEKPVHLVMTVPESYVELFGENIQTGPMVRDMTGFVEMNVMELENLIKELSSEEDALKINIVNVNGTEKFSNWQPVNLN